MIDTTSNRTHAQIVSSDNLDDGITNPNVKLFAVLGTWMEADIVEATVLNAFTQGCERVYLVDNDSSDGTVQRACAQGAILAHSFHTDSYDEKLRISLMNETMREISEYENEREIWWLFLDADEFPHGPSGMTISQYIKTLDKKFRVVGSRFFDHYPSGSTSYKEGFHPIDFQPLCEEISLPMCKEGHRKHSLLKYVRGDAQIAADVGFHLVFCEETVYEPSQPIFLHHFPFRNESSTRARLAKLWDKNETGASRADPKSDTHMLARARSLEAVYRERWRSVVNFVSLDPISEALGKPHQKLGVSLKPWSESVDLEHQPILRWYPRTSAWKYDSLPVFQYGDDTTYLKGMEFLHGFGLIEDWGCGFCHAKKFIKSNSYLGIDGSSPWADKIVDLLNYSSNTDCIFMRHVLEHNSNWQLILENAVKSFSRRMVLILFTPFSEVTRTIATNSSLTNFPLPDISFRKEDLTRYFNSFYFDEQSLKTDTQYGTEHIFYIDKTRPLAGS
jgi:hypothetical protein